MCNYVQIHVMSTDCYILNTIIYSMYCTIVLSNSKHNMFEHGSILVNDAVAYLNLAVIGSRSKHQYSPAEAEAQYSSLHQHKVPRMLGWKK